MTDEEETLQKIKALAFEVDKNLIQGNMVNAYVVNQKLIQALGRRERELKDPVSGSLTKGD